MKICPYISILHRLILINDVASLYGVIMKEVHPVLASFTLYTLTSVLEFCCYHSYMCTESISYQTLA